MPPCRKFDLPRRPRSRPGSGQKRQFRDPYGDWWDKQDRRNFGEPVHEDNDILTILSTEKYTHFKPAKGLSPTGVDLEVPNISRKAQTIANFIRSPGNDGSNLPVPVKTEVDPGVWRLGPEGRGTGSLDPRACQRSYSKGNSYKWDD
ncbi:hypothetical protein ACJ72_00879 [Emergomyces africanus]|uniref:Uncharacterized protein n=1 Tax=Emergomyces africanus TaxID=1955775 RepID=A0A1B7P6T4_9EURO|nr:hypothetical protein ACJ72_00879 [Emergomyces africanus]